MACSAFSISPPAKKGAAADLFLDSVVASRNLLDVVADRKPMRIVLVSSFRRVRGGRTMGVERTTKRAIASRIASRVA